MKNILITGGSKGIGLAIARIFAAKNVRLILCARSEADLKIAGEELATLQEIGEIKYKSADLSIKADVQTFANWCAQFGTIDILINNAGSYVPGNVMDEADDNMEKMMDVNFYSAYHLTRALIPDMIAAGSGHIFNICSIAALSAYAGGGSYSVSKNALAGFGKNLRAELKNKNIKVTNIFPGAVYTDSWVGFDNSTGRIMEAEDIAIMVKAATLLSAQAVVEEMILRPQLGDL